MRMIAEFEKMGRMSWFSHLDLQSTMQRALRRSGLPVRYSQGFNPHVNLSFAIALSVGCQSRCEILDVEMEREVAPEQFLERLNLCLPEGLKCFRAAAIEDRAPALMALMQEAEYTVNVKNVDLTASVNAFMQAETVEVEKKTKTKVRMVDIRPLVHEMTCETVEGNSVIRMILENTNANVLKAELLMQALAPDLPFTAVRTGFFGRNLKGQRIGLFEAGMGVH